MLYKDLDIKIRNAINTIANGVEPSSIRINTVGIQTVSKVIFPLTITVEELMERANDAGIEFTHNKSLLNNDILTGTLDRFTFTVKFVNRNIRKNIECTFTSMPLIQGATHEQKEDKPAPFEAGSEPSTVEQ